MLNPQDDGGNSYFHWLCREVGAVPDNGYVMAFMQLDSTTFKVLVPNDDNRAADGVYFRHYYTNETGMSLPPSEASRPCSLFEMLVAIADRYAFAVCPVGKDQDLPAAFRHLVIENLGLTKNIDKNSAIIRNLNDRTYQPNGVGSLFPLKNPRYDMRDREIWYQMQDYLIENHLGN